MGGKETEACGRCAMSSVVDTTMADGEGGRDPFGDERIELSDAELRAASAPAVWAGKVKRRLDEIATRLTYGH